MLQLWRLGWRRHYILLLLIACGLSLLLLWVPDSDMFQSHHVLSTLQQHVSQPERVTLSTNLWGDGVIVDVVRFRPFNVPKMWKGGGCGGSLVAVAQFADSTRQIQIKSIRPIQGIGSGESEETYLLNEHFEREVGMARLNQLLNLDAAPLATSAVMTVHCTNQSLLPGPLQEFLHETECLHRNSANGSSEIDAALIQWLPGVENTPKHRVGLGLFHVLDADTARFVVLNYIGCCFRSNGNYFTVNGTYMAIDNDRCLREDPLHPNSTQWYAEQHRAIDLDAVWPELLLKDSIALGMCDMLAGDLSGAVKQMLSLRGSTKQTPLLDALRSLLDVEVVGAVREQPLPNRMQGRLDALIGLWERVCLL